MGLHRPFEQAPLTDTNLSSGNDLSACEISTSAGYQPLTSPWYQHDHRYQHCMSLQWTWKMTLHLTLRYPYKAPPPSHCSLPPLKWTPRGRNSQQEIHLATTTMVFCPLSLCHATVGLLELVCPLWCPLKGLYKKAHQEQQPLTLGPIP